MDAGNLQFEDAAFDSVLATFVMSVVPNPSLVLIEIERIIRPAGKVFLFNHFCADSRDKSLLALAERASTGLAQGQLSFRLFAGPFEFCQ